MSLFLSDVSRRRAKIGLLACSLTLSSPFLANAQQQSGEESGPRRQLSEKVSEEIGKVQPLVDAKNYDGAIALIDPLLAVAEKESYDFTLLSQIKAQVYMFKGEYSKVLEPLEAAYLTASRHKYFDEKPLLDVTNLLSQLYFQEASTIKDAAKQKEYFSKAASYIEQFLAKTPKPSADTLLYYAHLLYTQAQINPEQVDMALIKKVQEISEQGLRAGIKPRDNFYLLLLATYQQQGDYEKSAELLELLVKLFPSNQTYWQQLLATYLSQGKDVRAIVTIERAQKQGLMNTPKDNFNLVGIYFNMQQFEKAVELLDAGLRNGGIDPEQKNWELLAASYQQLHKELKAIDVLKDAVKVHPKAGQLELLIGHIYFSIDKAAEAMQHLQAAIAKGGLERPAQAQIFLAHMAYELKKYDIANQALDEAAKDPSSLRDVERLRRAIKDALEERENNAQKTTV